MAINEAEAAKQHLVNLNRRIGEMEQKRDEEAIAFFQAHLSEHLVFRRASGKIVGKSEPEGFLDNLTKPRPFTSLVSEEISVALIDDNALVTLIVVGTRPDGSVGRYRNIRLFSPLGDDWVLELWYNYELTSQ